MTCAAGNERKKSGSYYTPSELIALVLAEALDPLIAEALQHSDPEGGTAGSHRRRPRLRQRTFRRRVPPGASPPRWPRYAPATPNPAPAGVRAATADVIERCLYGVDLNDLAIEITKVALWLEAFDADRPLPFLDAHFRVGNALLGTTPRC